MDFSLFTSGANKFVCVCVCFVTQNSAKSLWKKWAINISNEQDGGDKIY
jgi:hypothetical protein